MSEWIMILLEVEDDWTRFAATRSISARGLDSEDYMRMRDGYKARRIFELYGYDYFLQFVDKCPHIAELKEIYLPCRQRGECSMFCKFFERGCTYATE